MLIVEMIYFKIYVIGIATWNGETNNYFINNSLIDLNLF